MERSALIAIDNDGISLEKLKGALEDLELLREYDYHTILPCVRAADEAIAYCVDQVLEFSRSNVIALVLVDIELFETEELPKDTTGLKVAGAIHDALPEMPVCGMTRWIKDHRLLTETALDRRLDGFALKQYWERDGFSRKDFALILSSSRERASIRVAHMRKSRPSLVATQGSFQIQQDLLCLCQVHEIGEQTLMALLGSLFPAGGGTVAYMRPGFSGSYLFKVSVKTTVDGMSSSSVRRWAVKVCDDEARANSELERYKTLRARVTSVSYPGLLREEVTTVGKWAASAIEMRDDAVTFFNYLRAGEDQKCKALVASSLIPFLKNYYGDAKRKQCFVWNTFFALDDKSKAAILAFTDEARAFIRRKFQSLEPALDKVRSLVRSSGDSQEALGAIDAEVDTYYLHGDLHARNILVNENGTNLLMIDFADSVQDHCMKDIATLETDLIFMALDSEGWNDLEWDRMDLWSSVLELNSVDRIFAPRIEYRIEDAEVARITDLICTLRESAQDLWERSDGKQYLMALCHSALKLLSYSEVPVQKKVFALKYIDGILSQLSHR